MKVKVGVSARHIHLNEETFKKLFGDDALLTVKAPLEGLDQFACNETVNIITDNARFDNVRIIGPLRSYNQVELSLSDTFKLKINAPLRDSGDLKGSASITVEGPANTLKLDECVMVPLRHIHVNTKDKGMFDNISMVSDGIRSASLNNIHVKYSSDVKENIIHIDTDEANALLIKNNDYVEVIKC